MVSRAPTPAPLPASAYQTCPRGQPLRALNWRRQNLCRKVRSTPSRSRTVSAQARHHDALGRRSSLTQHRHHSPRQSADRDALDPAHVGARDAAYGAEHQPEFEYRRGALAQHRSQVRRLAGMRAGAPYELTPRLTGIKRFCVAASRRGRRHARAGAEGVRQVVHGLLVKMTIVMSNAATCARHGTTATHSARS
jgi:hypothetical protein